MREPVHSRHLNVTAIRANKQIAQRIWDKLAGNVWMQSSKLSFHSTMMPPVMVSRDLDHEQAMGESRTFATAVNNYKYYHCQLNETGLYVHFYVDPNHVIRVGILKVRYATWKKRFSTWEVPRLVEHEKTLRSAIDAIPYADRYRTEDGQEAMMQFDALQGVIGRRD